MAIDSLAQHLLRQPIFQGLRPLFITEIVRRADRAVFRPGDLIMEEDTQAEAAILLVAGDAVRVAGAGPRARTEAIAAGSLLTEMAMLIETSHSATIVARTAVRALLLPRTELHELMAIEPEVADHFVAKIAGRLAEVAAELRAIDGLLARQPLECYGAAPHGSTHH